MSQTKGREDPSSSDYHISTLYKLCHRLEQASINLTREAHNMDYWVAREVECYQCR